MMTKRKDYRKYKKYKRLRKYKKNKDTSKFWLVVYVLIFIAYYIKLLFFD